MRSPLTLTLCLSTIILFTLPASGHAQDKMKTDSEQLMSAGKLLQNLGNRSKWTLSDTTSQSIGKNAPWMLKTLRKQQEALQVGALVRPIFKAFRSTYVAKLRPDQSVSNELNNKFRAIAPRIGVEYGDIARKLPYIDKAPAHNAKRCLDLLEQNGTSDKMIANLHPIYKTKAIVEARAMLNICVQFLPNDKATLDRTEALRPKVEALLKKYKKLEMEAAAKKKWHPNVKRLSAGSPKALAKKGLAFLRGHEAWGRNKNKTKVRKVSVVKDWFVAERNIFGKPTKWGLPVHVAVTKKDTLRGLAQVYELSLITTGSKKAAPFGGYWVGDTWMMLKKNLR